MFNSDCEHHSSIDSNAGLKESEKDQKGEKLQNLDQEDIPKIDKGKGKAKTVEANEEDIDEDEDEEGEDDDEDEEDDDFVRIKIPRKHLNYRRPFRS